MTTTYASQQSRDRFAAYKGSMELDRAGHARSAQVATMPHSVTSSRVVVRTHTPRRSAHSSHTASALFTRKRILIGFLVAASVLAVLLPANKAFGGLSLVSSKRPSAEMKSSVVTIVVKKGDTLWSIARRLEPKRDPRKVVDELVSVRGTANVNVGDTIKWAR